MKLATCLAVITLTFCSASSAEMKQMFSTWVERSRSASDDRAALSALLKEVMKAYPDANERLTSFYDFAMEKHAPEMEQQARMTLAAIWPELAPPDIRARFLSKRVGQANSNDLSALRAYLERDIVRPEAVAAVEKGTIQEPTGVAREHLLSAEHYSVDNPLPARILALLFELTPASVVLDLSEIGDKREVADLVQTAESARHRFENAAPADAVAAWEDVQSVLRRMLEMNNPALDGYVARIMAWRKNGPSLSNDPSIINTLNARNDPVVKYLLSGKGLMSLLEIESSQPALLKSASSVKKQAASNGTPPLLTLSSTLAKAPESKPASTPNEEPASSTPWGIIVVLIVAAGGLLWLLLKRRS